MQVTACLGDWDCRAKEGGSRQVLGGVWGAEVVQQIWVQMASLNQATPKPCSDTKVQPRVWQT